MWIMIAGNKFLWLLVMVNFCMLMVVECSVNEEAQSNRLSNQPFKKA